MTVSVICMILRKLKLIKRDLDEIAKVIPLMYRDVHPNIQIKLFL